MTRPARALAALLFLLSSIPPAAIAQATSSRNGRSRGLTGSHATSAPYDGVVTVPS